MSYAGSNLQDILNTLTTALCARGTPLGNVIGQAADAQTMSTSSGSIVWVPRDKQPALSPPHEQPSDVNDRPLGVAIAQRNLVVDAVIYGKDFQSAQDIDDRLIVALYEEFGENGAAIFSAPPGELDGGGARSGEGWCVVRPVIFSIPIFQQKFIRATGAPVLGVGSVTDPLGENSEPI